MQNIDNLALLLSIRFFFINIFNSISVKQKDPGGSMSQVVGLHNYSYKPITNTSWVRVQLCKLQKGCIRLAAASDNVYQLLAHGRWFSASLPTSPTTKTGRHDIAEILLKVALSNNHPLIQLQNNIMYNIPSSVSSQCCSYYCIYTILTP